MTFIISVFRMVYKYEYVVFINMWSLLTARVSTVSCEDKKTPSCAFLVRVDMCIVDVVLPESENQST